MILRWFGSLIDAFAGGDTDTDTATPPRNLARFYLFYLRQAWPVLEVMAPRRSSPWPRCPWPHPRNGIDASTSCPR